MKNKKVGVGLLVLGLLIGGGAMIAHQIYAQSPIVTAPVVTTSGDVQTAGDTDNIQDPGGIEKPDTVGQDVEKEKSHASESENEANDTDGGANEDAN